MILGYQEELTTGQEAHGGKMLPTACSETSCDERLLIQKLGTGNSPIVSMALVRFSDDNADVEKV